MAFMKFSKSVSKIKTVDEESLLQGLSEKEIVALLKRHLDGKNIGFTPTNKLLKKYNLQ